MSNGHRRFGLAGGLFAVLIATAIIGVFAVQDRPQPDFPTGETTALSQASTTGKAASSPSAEAGTGNDAYDPNSAIVLFEPEITADEINASLAQAAGLTSSMATEDDIDRGFMRVDLAEGASVESAVAELQGLPGIGHSQPNFSYRLLEDDRGLTAGIISTLATTINDTRHAEQWHLDSEHGVDAYDAWDLVKTNGAVTVAVVDSGCTSTHTDLVGNIVGSYDATEVTGKNSGTADISSNGHGTHVCGIVAATANNNEGVAGVSYNAKFIPIQVFYKTGGSMGTNTAELLAAYNYILDNAESKNIRVVNMSLGGMLDPLKDDAVIAAIEKAYDQGILTICAAGNDDYPRPYTIYPGDYLKDGHGLNVIAVDKYHEKPDYSNFNKQGQQTKDIAAPGGTDTKGEGILSTIKAGYGELYGTSMATPVVSGIASLIFAANPDLTPGQVIDIMHSTATDLGDEGWDETYGYGLVNAFEAVKCAKAQVDGDDAVMVGRRASFTASPDANGSWTWASDDESVATVADGTVTGVAPGKVAITAKRGSFSISKDITVYSASITGSSSIQTGQTTSLALSANPAGGTWSWTSSNTRVATVSAAAEGATVTGASAGSATITATLAGHPTITATFNIAVSDPQQVPPVSEYELTGPSSLMKGSSITLAPNSSGTWSWSSSNTGVAIVSDGVVTGAAAGRATISASNAAALGTKTVTVYEAAITGTSTAKVGTTTELSLSAQPTGGTWNWSSSNPRVATVTPASGGATVTGVGAGSSTITASLAGNPDIAASFDIIIEASPVHEGPIIDPNPPTTTTVPDVSNLTVTVNGGPFTYTGSPLTPAVTVTAGGKTLADGDYALAYSNNTKAGNEATVTVKGRGAYDDLFEKSATFTISKASQKIAVKAATATATTASMKSRSRTVHCIKKVTGLKTQLVYSKKSGSKRLSVNKKTGLVTVKKKTKKGTYKISVKVYAKENANFIKSNTVTKTLKVKVK